MWYCAARPRIAVFHSTMPSRNWLRRVFSAPSIAAPALPAAAASPGLLQFWPTLLRPAPRPPIISRPSAPACVESTPSVRPSQVCCPGGGGGGPLAIGGGPPPAIDGGGGGGACTGAAVGGIISGRERGIGIG